MKSFAKVWLSIGIVVIVLGIGLLVVNVTNGFTIEDIPTYSEEVSFAKKDINAIDINVDYGEFYITEGDKFYIKGENIPKDSLEVYVDDEGTWNIRQNSNYMVEVFGIDISLGHISWWENKIKQKIEITIPKDFIATDFVLDFGAGSAKIDNIHATKGKFSIGAGQLVVGEVKMEEKASFEVGAGELIIHEMNINNITVDCGVGRVKMNGTITGNNDIYNGIGEVVLNLNGNLEEYAFHIDKGIGNIKINGDNYRNIKRLINRFNNATNKINLDCGIGEIDINIH